MLQSFRSFFKSRIGIVLTLAFLGLIALAFASADISGSGQFGGVAGGDRAALVDDDKIGTGELSRAASETLERMRQEQPTATMAEFLAQGGLEQVLDDLIDRSAIIAFGHKGGMRAGDRLIDSEIAQIQAFKGPDGKFSADLYRQLVRQQGLTEQMVRDDIAQQLMARQVLGAVGLGSSIPRESALRYAALLRERRAGSIGFIPSAAFAPSANPDDKKIAAYYAEHRSDYTRPERRVLRYATFGEEALGAAAEPTEQEIAARYKRDEAQYAASETRSFTQLVAASKSAADAIQSELAKGKSLKAVASEKELATTAIAATTRQKLAASASEAVAKAAFEAKRGSVAGPVQGGLGWYLLQVDGVNAKPGRSLDQVRGEIRSTLAAEKHRAAIANLGAEIEEQIDDGASLADIAEQLKLTLSLTGPLLADGSVYGKQNERVPAVLSRALSTAFAMEEEAPQVAEVEPGKTFLVYEVREITPSAPAPLDEIRDRVAADLILAEGASEAKAAADRILAQSRKGTALAKAIAGEKQRLPAPQSISMSRDELAALGDKVPGPLAMFFSMSQGTTKRLEAPGNAGWYVVRLDTITPGKISDTDPIIAQATTQLGQLVGEEYAAQFRAAVRSEVGVERNPNAIASVRRRLAGEN